MSKQQLKQAGFTIIEVVLVLAIAALIFLMVFIALPALQRSQRDDARKKDVTIISSDLAAWQGNNRTGAPDGAALLSYGAASANTETVTVVINATAGNVDTADGTITVYKGFKCGTASPKKVTLVAGSVRQYAIVTQLESGNNTGFCLDS